LQGNICTRNNQRFFAGFSNRDATEQKYCTVDFEYTLAKGRSRYVCIRNLINLAQDNANEELPFNTDLLNICTRNNQRFFAGFSNRDATE
jgi:Rad3-related DNA helicase